MEILKLIPAFKVLPKATSSSKQSQPISLSSHPTPSPSGLTLIKRVSRDLDSVTASVNRIQARLAALPVHRLGFEGGGRCGEALTGRRIEKSKDCKAVKRLRLIRHS